VNSNAPIDVDIVPRADLIGYLSGARRVFRKTVINVFSVTKLKH